MLQYILEVTLCWALFYLIFFGLLRKLTFFSVNRWYLLGSLILGMLIPQLRYIELNMYQEEISESIPIAIMVKELPAQVAVTMEEATIQWSEIIAEVLWGVYILGLIFFGWRLLRSLYRIYSLYAGGRKVDLDGSKVVYTQSEHLPFSFWDRVYISEQVELTHDFQDILKHERTHVKSRHSIDVLLIELIQITFWFNPMIYLYKTALRQTHEYLADAAVLQHTSRKTYGTMLLKQSLSGLEIALTHQFFHSHVKKRINMMYQKKSGRSAWLKYALAVPVLFVLTVVFANRSSTISTSSDKNLNPLTCELTDLNVLTDVDETPMFSQYDTTIDNLKERRKSASANLSAYLYNHLSSDPTISYLISGKSIEISMTIGKYGKLYDIELNQELDDRVDQAIKSLLVDLNEELMPFIPAIKNEASVSSSITCTLSFDKVSGIGFDGRRDSTRDADFVSTDTDSILADFRALHRTRQINSFYRISDFTNEVNVKRPIKKEGIVVSVEEEILSEDVDYSIDEEAGKLRIINEAYNKAGKQVHVRYQEDNGQNNPPVYLFPVTVKYSIIYIGGEFDAKDLVVSIDDEMLTLDKDYIILKEPGSIDIINKSLINNSTTVSIRFTNANSLDKTELPKRQSGYVYMPNSIGRFVEHKRISPKVAKKKYGTDGSQMVYEVIYTDPSKIQIDEEHLRSIKKIPVGASHLYAVNGVLVHEHTTLEELESEVSEGQVGEEIDTLIIYDPKTFNETMIIRPQDGQGFQFTLRYKDDQVILTSSNAAWSDLSFTIRDDAPQIIDEFGIANSINHEAQFTFEMIKSGNEFKFKSHHGLDWVDLSGHCDPWHPDKSKLTISESGIMVNCF